jgi:hypothetical protein
MNRRRALALAGGLLCALAALGVIPLADLANGGGLGPDPFLDFLVWFVPITAILGVVLLTTALLLSPRRDASLPYRPL